MEDLSVKLNIAEQEATAARSEVDDLTSQLNEARSNAAAAHNEVEALKAKLDTVSTTHNHAALLEKIEGLEKKNYEMESAITEWTEVATVGFLQP